MNKFPHFLAALVLTAFLVTHPFGATPTDNIPISQMPITTQVLEQAYFPLIQKYPGRSTNDNFRATISTLFHGRAGETITNIAATNIYVSNIYATTIFATNIYATNLLVINTNNYFTNLFVTNLYVSNIFIGDSEFFNTTQFTYDPLGDNIVNISNGAFVTNLISFESLSAYGSFFIPTSLSSNLVAGENDLSVYQTGSMLLQGSSTDPADTSVNLNSGGSGQFLFIENGVSSGFTIYDGTPLWDSSGYIILMPGLGDWRPTQRGETIFFKKSQNQNWQEIGRFGGSTNSGGGGESLWKTNVGSASISPFVTGTAFYIDSGARIGIGAVTNIFDGKTFGAFRQVDIEGPEPMFLNTGIANTWPSPTYYSEWWSKITTNEGVQVLVSSSSLGTFEQVWTTANDNPGSFFYYQMLSNSVPTLELDGYTGDIYTLGSITFGPGMTNTIYRNGVDIVYTNGLISGNAVSFKIGTPSGEAAFTQSGSVARVQGVNAVDLYDSTKTLRWAQGFLFPFESGVVLGGVGTSVNKAFGNLELDGHYYQYGYYDSTATNYARLDVSFANTNSAIVFDSQSGGIAGSPKPFSLTNATVYANINSSGVMGYLSQFSMTPTNIRSGLLGTGDSDVYTVPSGKRLLVRSVSAGTTNQSSTSMFSEVKTNGVYFRISTSVTVTTNSGNLISVEMVFEAGETVSFNSSNTGANVVVSGLLYDNTVPVYSPRLKTITGGTDVLYTSPANTIGVPYSMFETMSRQTSGQFAYMNTTGAPVLVSVYHVASGGSIGPGNIINSADRNNNTRSVVNIYEFMPGDFLAIVSASSSASQWAYLTVVEIPFSN